VGQAVRLASCGTAFDAVYPKTRRVWIRRAGSSTSELLNDAIRSELLPGIEIRLDKIFD
jgi:hypothetical protein